MSEVLPYCVYRRKDNPYISQIVSGLPVKGEKDNYTCRFKFMESNWDYDFTFYAINPTLSITPAKIELLCFTNQSESPNGLAFISHVLDKYNQKNCTYMLAYRSPNPNTIPIYFYQNGTYIYPSKSDKAPKGWKPHEFVPVIFTIDTNDYKNVPFRCVNSRCIPWFKNIPDVFDVDNDTSTMRLRDCVMYCNELTPSMFKGSDPNILAVVKKMSKSQKPITNLFKKVPSWLIGIIIGVFVLLLLILVSKNTKD